jgi:hypothetical protein
LYPFFVSKRFYGKICDGRSESECAVQYQDLFQVQQVKLAEDLAMFFHLMHQIDYKKLNISAPSKAIDNWNITTREDFDYNSAKETLQNYQIDLDD